MAETRNKHLKAWNLPWLIALVALDVLILLGIVFPDLIATTSMTQVNALRFGLNSMLPVPTLILTGLLPSKFKEVLVFWRIKDHLPGARAFTKHGPADHRIDMANLRKNVGNLPTSPREQNSLWYKLYRKVDNEIGVLDANRHFLRFREMSALSFLLAIIVPFVMTFTALPAHTIWQSFAVFAVQYLLTCIAARNSGIRLVCSVLAEHSVKRVTAGPVKAK
jgi:hypothetical protein